MSMNQLPRELIQLILQHLNPVDRLNSSLTCRDWAENVSSSSSLEDIWRIIYGSDTETVIESQRQYRNIRIFGADLSDDNVEFWEKVGRYLRRLELIECNLTPEVFKTITKHCPELKSLEVKANRRLVGPRYYFSEETFPARDRDKSGKVQHLGVDSYMTEEIIEHLLTSMPHVASFSLRFGDSLHCLPCILKARHTFTKLEIFCGFLTDEYVVALVEMYSESLQVLRLLCGRLTHPAYSAIGDCTRLQHLSIIDAPEFADSHLEKVVRNAPELEALDVFYCPRLTDAGLAHIHVLKGLRNLGILSASNLSIDAFRRAGDIPTLKYLNFDESNVDITVIRNIGSIKDLRVLRLTVPVDSQSFDIICNNLGMLEELWLNCYELNDADGVKLRRLTRVKILRLRDCDRFTDLTFEKGFGSPAMECLSVSASPLSRVELASLAAHHGRLKELKFVFCKNITDAGLAILLRREPFLEVLTLKSCKSLSDRCLEELENTCPRLRSLRLHSCRTSAGAVELFKRRRPVVRVEHKTPISQ